MEGSVMRVSTLLDVEDDGKSIKSKTNPASLNAMLRKQLQPMCSIMCLNELVIGLEYDVQPVATVGHFTASVDVNGGVYRGYGFSRKLAKMAAAEAALFSFVKLHSPKAAKPNQPAEGDVSFVKPYSSKPAKPDQTAEGDISFVKPYSSKPAKPDQTAEGDLPKHQVTAEISTHKCKNLISELLKFASNQEAKIAKSVTNLILSLIDDKVDAEFFAEELQNNLNSSPQPSLVPFLKKTLPSLRTALVSGEIQIEGVNPAYLIKMAATPSLFPILDHEYESDDDREEEDNGKGLSDSKGEEEDNDNYEADETPWRTIGRFALYKLFAGWTRNAVSVPPQCHMPTQEKNIPDLHHSITRMQNQRIVPSNPQGTCTLSLANMAAYVQSPPVRLPVRDLSKAVNRHQRLNPLMVLNEISPKLVYDATPTVDPVTKTCAFSVTVNMGTYIYTGKGSTIKKAKFNVAKTVLKEAFGIDNFCKPA